jgi:hypothetical protein
VVAAHSRKPTIVPTMCFYLAVPGCKPFSQFIHCAIELSLGLLGYNEARDRLDGVRPRVATFTLSTNPDSVELCCHTGWCEQCMNSDADSNIASTNVIAENEQGLLHRRILINQEVSS